MAQMGGPVTPHNTPIMAVVPWTKAHAYKASKYSFTFGLSFLLLFICFLLKGNNNQQASAT